MTHILMAISVIILIISTLHTRYQYLGGKVPRAAVIRLMAITGLFILALIIMLLYDFVIFPR
ncbi:MAG: hypothetical protein FWC67_03800 [Defluviitaleaceae bacterium]|nr:hypothetical protein [Defluviitaleaceae bacterium]